MKINYMPDFIKHFIVRYQIKQNVLFSVYYIIPYRPHNLLVDQ